MKNGGRIQFLENKQLMYSCIQNMLNHPILGWVLYVRILPFGSVRFMDDFICLPTPSFDYLQHFAHQLTRFGG